MAREQIAVAPFRLFMNAGARRNLPLLQALNEGCLPPFASGGLPSSAAIAPADLVGQTVNANGSVPPPDQDIADRIGR